MININWEEREKRKFNIYIIQESEGYICPNFCEPDSMKIKNIKYINSYTAEVELTCDICKYTKTISIENYDD